MFDISRMIVCRLLYPMNIFLRLMEQHHSIIRIYLLIKILGFFSCCCCCFDDLIDCLHICNRIPLTCQHLSFRPCSYGSISTSAMFHQLALDMFCLLSPSHAREGIHFRSEEMHVSRSFRQKRTFPRSSNSTLHRLLMC